MRQELFNKVVRHLLTQMMRAEQARTDADCGRTMCLYRAEGGLKCAFGALIPGESEQVIDNVAWALWERSRDVRTRMAQTGHNPPP